MKRLVTGLLVFSAFLLLPQAASAELAPLNLKQAFRVILGSATIVIPPEWDGIWEYQDSTYDCQQGFQSTDSGVDTLCSGAVVLDPGILLCTGSATATTISVTCEGMQELIPDCVATYSYSILGTRTGDTYFVVSTYVVSYDGTAEGCDLIPDSCTQTNSRGIRTGPAPSDYCATPALPSTWGELKIRYR